LIRPGLTDTTGPPGGFLSPSDEVFIRGELLYTVNCVACHGGENGETTGLAPAHNEDGTVWRLADSQIEGRIRLGSLSERSMMPSFGYRLTDKDIDAVVAVMKTWWTPEQRRAQAETTRAFDGWTSGPATGE
jgi:mono/diheme cytochrome c family protein